MKNDANIRNFIEISGNMHGKSRNMHGKSGIFRGIHSPMRRNRRSFLRSFAVVSGHFRSFFRSFLIWFRKISFLIPFDSFSFPNTPILCSTACFYVNYSHRENFSRKIFGSSKYSPYLCHRLTDDSSLSGRATVSPMASCRRLFLCQRISLPNWRILFS